MLIFIFSMLKFRFICLYNVGPRPIGIMVEKYAYRYSMCLINPPRTAKICPGTGVFQIHPPPNKRPGGGRLFGDFIAE